VPTELFPRCSVVIDIPNQKLDTQRFLPCKSHRPVTVAAAQNIVEHEGFLLVQFLALTFAVGRTWTVGGIRADKPSG
jgi:hypothetical protein